MKKVYTILVIILLLWGLVAYASTFYTNTITDDENTMIISVCTGQMRTLETGVSVYAGYKKIPLILSDTTLPIQLKKWLPHYLKENNITKVIITGPVSIQEKYDLIKLGVNVEQVEGDTISSILTKLAENTHDKNNNSIIITASDPLAGYYGAYTKTPVFTTATNSTYHSSQKLDENYKNYITEHDIKNVTIIGSIPEGIKDDLRTLNVSIEEISGENSLALSDNINSKLKQQGLLNDTSEAYYGFYGELPTMIPSIIQDNAMLIEDASNTQQIMPLIDKYNISSVYITRNTESDYIQMEETDYVSSNVIRDLEENNVSVKYMVRPRTLDEATGLYDNKIITSEYLENHTMEEKGGNITNSIESEPPLIAILNTTSVTDSNNVTANITRYNNTVYIVKWDTIHPYMWTKYDEEHFHATSNTGYQYYWTRNNNRWEVNYLFNNTPYYNVTWKRNDDKTWTEIHENNNYTWVYDGGTWECYNQKNQSVYAITIDK